MKYLSEKFVFTERSSRRSLDISRSPTLSVPVGTKRPGASSWQSSLRPLSSGSGTSRLSPLLLTHRRNLAASEPAGSEAESLSPARRSAWRGLVTVGEIWNQNHFMRGLFCPCKCSPINFDSLMLRKLSSRQPYY